jgi:hypothetical protein
MEENMSWLQAKVAAQAKALDLMHSTIVRQRFVLRAHGEKGWSLTREEFLAAKAEVASEQSRQRIGDPDPV